MFPHGRTMKKRRVNFKMSAVKRIKQLFQKEWKGKEKEAKEMHKGRLLELRREPVIMRIGKPTNIPRARELGYKAKQGITVARIKIRKSSGLHKRVRAGRKPSRQGIKKLKRAKSTQLIAEERIARKYPNLEVLNSYLVMEDGQYKWFEVILVDPTHPAIKKDKDLKWICSETRRVYRNKTSAGKKSKPKTKAKGKKNKQRKKY